MRGSTIISHAGKRVAAEVNGWMTSSYQITLLWPWEPTLPRNLPGYESLIYKAGIKGAVFLTTGSTMEQRFQERIPVLFVS